MVSTFTGIILGDVVLGLKVGALIELAFAGLTPAEELSHLTLYLPG